VGFLRKQTKQQDQKKRTGSIDWAGAVRGGERRSSRGDPINLKESWDLKDDLGHWKVSGTPFENGVGVSLS